MVLTLGDDQSGQDNDCISSSLGGMNTADSQKLDRHSSKCIALVTHSRQLAIKLLPCPADKIKTIEQHSFTNRFNLFTLFPFI